MDCLTIDPATADLDELVERGTRLHGHLGPFLVAGIRMGLLALELMESSGYFGIRAESDAGFTTPLSCLSDGVQIGSGCTIGKGNLRVTSAGKPSVRFANEESRAVEISIRPQAMQQFRSMEIHAASEWTKTQPLEGLFVWKRL